MVRRESEHKPAQSTLSVGGFSQGVLQPWSSGVWVAPRTIARATL